MKITKITDKKITFDNGTTIEYYHEQDCCEHVYADFKALNDTGILETEINEINIEPIKDFGFKLNGFPIPCYDEQNGYYSFDLELTIKEKKGKGKNKRTVITKKIDLTTCLNHDNSY